MYFKLWHKFGNCNVSSPFWSDYQTLDLLFVFLTTTAENPSSCKYNVIRESKLIKPCLLVVSLDLVYPCFTNIQYSGREDKTNVDLMVECDKILTIGFLIKLCLKKHKLQGLIQPEIIFFQKESAVKKLCENSCSLLLCKQLCKMT